MVTPFQWTCSYCNHGQIVTDNNHQEGLFRLQVGNTEWGMAGLSFQAIRCVNSDCNQLTLMVALNRVDWGGPGSSLRAAELKNRWSLLPRSHAKPLPDYIPKQIRDDYLEACLIRDLSPKASATLARRVLQGMIRDFCSIQKKTLYQEILQLEDDLEKGTAPRGVEPESIAAIHAVRTIGNIGAHMEADIDTIINVEPDEAQALINLIEMLFDEWYIARHKRAQNLKNLLEIQGIKQEAQKGSNKLPQSVSSDEVDEAPDGQGAQQAAIPAPPHNEDAP